MRLSALCKVHTQTHGRENSELLSILGGLFNLWQFICCLSTPCLFQLFKFKYVLTMILFTAMEHQTSEEFVGDLFWAERSWVWLQKNPPFLKGRSAMFTSYFSGTFFNAKTKMQANDNWKCMDISLREMQARAISHDNSTKSTFHKTVTFLSQFSSHENLLYGARWYLEKSLKSLESVRLCSIMAIVIRGRRKETRMDMILLSLHSLFYLHELSQDTAEPQSRNKLDRNGSTKL